MTGAQSGLTGDDQIRICLERMAENGGQATTPELYDAVENHMNGARLSESGKAYVRHCVNQIAVRAGLVYPHDPDNPGWRITPEGRESISLEPMFEEVINSATGETEQQITNSAAGLAFELYVLELLKRIHPNYAWYHQGIHRRHERGLDFIGTRLGDTSGEARKIGVQVKCHAPHRMPSALEWKKFLAGCFARRLSSSMFITTGRLSADQRREADEANVIVIEGREEVSRIAGLHGLERFDLLEEQNA